MTKPLILSELELFDPGAPQRTGERRFLCPLCGLDKPRDAAHRSLCLNSASGLYQCKRCGCKGRLLEFWPEKTGANRAQIAAQRLRQSFEIAPVAHNVSESTDWIELWKQSEILGQHGDLEILEHRSSQILGQSSNLEISTQNDSSRILGQSSNSQTPARNFNLQTSAQNGSSQSSAQDGDSQISAQNGDSQISAQDGNSQSSAQNSNLQSSVQNGSSQISAQNNSESSTQNGNPQILARKSSLGVLKNSSSHAAALRYLARRAISLECARRNEVRLIPDWYHRAALGFPFKDESGAVVALSGRALRDGGLDKPASGPKKLGAFRAGALGFDPFDVAVPAVILCEAPFDALSLAMTGYPAIALGGTAAPLWLHRKCAFRRVLLAFDADEAGDNAAFKIGAHLASFGATCFRLRPQGAKDWNELLQNGGTEAIETLVAPIVSRLE